MCMPLPGISLATVHPIASWWVPLFKDGRLLGVLDLDSPSLARFSAADQAGIERLIEVFVELTDC